jgi:hypothetical protein
MFVFEFVFSFNFKINHFWVINSNRTLKSFCSDDLVNQIKSALWKSYLLDRFFWIHVWVYKLESIQICVANSGRYNCNIGFSRRAWFWLVKSWASNSSDFGVWHRLLHDLLLFEGFEVVFSCNFWLLSRLGSLTWLMLLQNILETLEDLL